ncbi:MAG: SAP domain-containing protein [Rhabdochlamydiaceae bacterium]
MRIKIGIDNGVLTQGKRKRGEICIFALVDSRNVKSPEDAHLVWMTCCGEESRQMFEEELLTTIVPAINKLIETPQLEIDGATYEIEMFLCCDLACLVKLVGLYDVYHPCSHFKCLWCKVKSETISEFKNEEPRTLEEQQQIGTEAQRSSNQREFAGSHWGTTGPPLFHFDWSRIIPCMLHVLMGTCRKMLELLIKACSEEPQSYMGNLSLQRGQELKSLCKKKKLTTTGSKNKLVRRLKETTNGQEEQEGNKIQQTLTNVQNNSSIRSHHHHRCKQCNCSTKRRA